MCCICTAVITVDTWRESERPDCWQLRDHCCGQYSIDKLLLVCEPCNESSRPAELEMMMASVED